MEGEGGHRLRSSVWSSETLMAGMKAIQGQLSTPISVKTEEDAELLGEFQASWSKVYFLNRSLKRL